MSIELIMNLISNICKYLAIAFLVLVFALFFSVVLFFICVLLNSGLGLDIIGKSTMLYLIPLGALIAIGLFKLIDS